GVGVQPVAGRLYLTVTNRDRAFADVDVALRAERTRVVRHVVLALVGGPVSAAFEVARPRDVLVRGALHVLVALLPDVVDCVEGLGVLVGEAVLGVPGRERRTTVLAVEGVARVTPVADDIARRERLLEGLEVFVARELDEGVTDL